MPRGVYQKLFGQPAGDNSATMQEHACHLHAGACPQLFTTFDPSYGV